MPARTRIALGIACSVLSALPAAADSRSATASADFSGTSWSWHSPLASASARLIGAYGGEQPPATATGVEPDGYNWRGASADEPDWRGVRRDIGYFLGYQFVAVAVVYMLPESISGWTSEQKEDYSLDRWRENVSRPVWDEDDWWINYVLHPYWGGAYYVQARERGLDRAQAFWYSALLSTLYEYGAEALAEPVSAQDLVVTPVAGALVGEYLFTPLRERIRSKPELDWSDKALLFITDPLGVLSAETDRLLGVRTALQLRPLGTRSPAGSISTMGAPADARSPAPVWGLQIRADW